MLKVEKIENLTQLEAAAKEYAELDQKVATRFARLRRLAMWLQNWIEKRLAPSKREMEGLKAKILIYADRNRQALKERAGGKTIELRYGKIVFRDSSEILIDRFLDKTTTLDLIKALPKKKRDGLLIVNESVSKTALGKMTDDELAALNAARVTHENVSFRLTI